MALTAKQQRFIAEYLIDLNATQAAIRAGFSKNGASSTAFNLLAKPAVKDEIEQRQKALAEKYGVTVERIIAELEKIGFSNLKNYSRLVGDARVIDMSATTDDELAALSEMTIEEFTEGRGKDAREVRKVKIKLHDKKGALVDLGKHLGMFKERIEVGGANGGPLQIVVIDYGKADPSA